MDGPEQESRVRDLEIAKNEATREMASKMRVSSWAVIAAAVLGLVAVMFYLVSKPN